MAAVNKSWSFEDLGLGVEVEFTREKFYDLSAKCELLHEMKMEFYKRGDLDSETLKYLEEKYEQIEPERERAYSILGYLRNLKNGYPFNVSSSVGREMKRHGLTKEEAEWFLNVHRAHMKALGTENQKKYTLPNVREVKYDAQEDTINVYYDDIWWHYDRRGQWY